VSILSTITIEPIDNSSFYDCCRSKVSNYMENANVNAMTNISSSALDPQLRMLLEVTYECMENGAISPSNCLVSIF